MEMSDPKGWNEETAERGKKTQILKYAIVERRNGENRPPVLKPRRCGKSRHPKL